MPETFDGVVGVEEVEGGGAPAAGGRVRATAGGEGGGGGREGRRWGRGGWVGCGPEVREFRVLEYDEIAVAGGAVVRGGEHEGRRREGQDCPG